MANEILMRTEINCETGEVKDIPLTADEIKAREEMIAFQNARIAEEEAELEAKAKARESAEAKLAALGLTLEEIAAL
jgi:hypothetical protein